MAKTVVVDISLGIKWVLAEPDTNTAEALLAEWDSNGDRMIAPSLFMVEAANVLFQSIRQGLLSQAEAETALTALADNGPELIRDDSLSKRALALTGELGLQQCYDSHYLALAEQENAEFWTADKKCWDAVQQKLPSVKWLGNYKPATT